MNFSMDDIESWSYVWERFKLLLRKCPNHNMSSMDQLSHFLRGFTKATRMLIDVSTRGTLRENIDAEVTTLIKNMCQNEQRSTKRVMKGKGVLAVDTQTSLLSQLISLTKMMVASQFTQANVSQIQTLKFDFCRGEHLNENYVPNIESAEVKYANFQRNNLYSKTYKPGWKDRPNFK